MDIAGCSLAELAENPLIGLVMKSDGVERRELESRSSWSRGSDCARPGAQTLLGLGS
jgi:hypothetical protein